MRYLVRERIFSIGNKFDIKDEFGQSHYRVEGRVFSFGKKLSIYDKNNNLALNIEQKVFRFLSEYHILKRGKIVGKVNKKLSMFRPKYDIESLYGNYSIDGDILHHDFRILKNGRQVANVSKRYISLSDTYTVDIDQDEDHSFILALVIVLDQVHHDNLPSRSNNTSN